MEKQGGVVSSMDASVQDVWDWEVLPDEHRSFYVETKPAAAASHGHGADDELLLGVQVPDQETEEPILDPGADAGHVGDECKDIGVDVAAVETRSAAQEQEEANMVPALTDSGAVTEPLASDAKEGVDDAEEEEMKKKGRARPDCVVFSVGKLRVNGIGALCSFGVAAATVGVFLAGGRLQHQQKIQQQQQKIQLQFLGDDKRIQQVVQQTSRLNQAVSSMMGAGASTRAKISFGGFYDGF
ncbi:uncharacterized protein LOC100838721 [Brachypodium distachyon]|uniref:DUF6821 domain-containing protein n=1 Tax=Brachypodium distachyon TaxID=15368 RepID=I1H2S1_BRADI|nr:uncharacterized protein LOC100838721 [Brachypodium distachyon]KQK20423.1 hypothetical protein BRADI_1g54440v3 [Brachypodium distachyon]|eukprot:XP_003557413.1 uncharacterized protein LOC100838721 [Brachypodium distachyon]